MKKRMGFVAVVLWAVAGLVACGAGESGGSEKTGEVEQLLCGTGYDNCIACGHRYCYYDPNNFGCPYCSIVNGHCECQ